MSRALGRPGDSRILILSLICPVSVTLILRCCDMQVDDSGSGGFKAGLFPSEAV